jgi:hypothetical protein
MKYRSIVSSISPSVIRIADTASQFIFNRHMANPKNIHADHITLWKFRRIDFIGTWLASIAGWSQQAGKL